MQQQTFMGSSIAAYGVTLGLNEQNTQLTVNLVDDPVNGDLFTAPLIGSPVYFSHFDDSNTFTHGGILQHYVSSSSGDGYPVYTVDVLDPRIILDGVQIILSGYIGATEVVPNLINIFGYLESQGFGNTLVNDGGVPFVKIRQALGDMIGVAGILSSHDYGGPFINFRGHNYSLDISEIPVTSPYYRVPGNFISLLELISIVCQDHGHDFHCVLIQSAISNIIKIKTIDRRAQPQGNVLSSYISNVSNVISKEVGKELRTDPTSMFLVGGQVQSLFTTTQVYYDSNNNIVDIYGDGGVIIDDADPEHIYYTISASGTLTKTIVSAATNSTVTIGTFDSTGFLYDGNNHITYNLRDDGLLTSIADDGQSKIVGTLHLNSPNADRTKTHILPFWGIDANGNVIIANVADRFAEANFNIDSRNWNVLGVGDTYNITMAEIRASLISQDAWATMLEIMDPSKAQSLGISDRSFFDVNGAFLDNVLLGVGRNTITKLNANTRVLNANETEFGHQNDNIFRLYNYVKEFATEHYGRKFMVRIPDVLATRESETGILVFSLDIADGGFLEDGAEPLGLPNYYSDLFTDQDGKFQAFVRLDNIQNYDLSNMTPGTDYVVINKNYPGGISVPYYAFIKCNVELNMVFLDYYNLTGPRAVITLPSPILLDIEKQTRAINTGLRIMWLKHFMGFGLTRMQYENAFYINNNLSRPSHLQDGTLIQPEQDTNFTLDDRLPNLYQFSESLENYNIRLIANPTAIRFSNTLSERLQAAISNIANGIENVEAAPIFKQPDFVAIPLIDHTTTYGPWYINSAIGKVSFEQDESLVPWNYGGFTQMNLAAQAKLISGTAKSQVLEAGSIQVPGVPTISIGDILSVGLPNITNIQVSINEQGITTTYNMQTYTPKFGVFAQQNAARFTRLTKQSQNIKRRLNQVIRAPSREQLNRRGSARFIGLDGSRILTAKSPHPVVLARNDVDISGRVVGTSLSFLSMGEAIAGVDGNNSKNFQSTSLMTLDGIFRPFSTASGNDGSHRYMPHFEKPSSGATEPTVFNLNPFASGDIYNPNTQMNTDINYVLSGDEYDRQDQLYAPNAYPSSVRGIGLRAPLIMVGWGYDTNGKPVPNVNPQNPGPLFATGYRTDSRDWKAGPLDARWDNNRKVWVATGDTIDLYAVIMQSGGRTYGLSNRPLYVVRPISSITNPSTPANAQLIYDDPTTTPPLSGVNDKVVFNIQESWGDLHTLGLGTPVILYNKHGVEFIDQLPRTFAIRMI
jgi:hypothetical protein